MARRSRPKRPRHTFVSGPSSAPPAYRDVLSVEIWHEVFSYCLPLSLLAVRNTCRLFRDIVERDNGALLARAPLLLPHPPPDPRWHMRYTRYPAKYRALGEKFGIANPWPRGTFGSAEYTKLLFLPGRCYICKGRAEGPPTWITRMIYLCSRRCRVEMFRSRVKYVPPKRCFRPKPTLPMDRHVVPVLPTFIMTKACSKTRKKVSILRCDLEKARREYWRRVVAPPTAEERKRGQASLFAVKDHIEMWRGKMVHEFKQTLKMNNALYVFHSPDLLSFLIDSRLRAFASKRKIPASEAFDNTSVRRTLLACSREFCRITPSILSDAGLLGPGSKRTKCIHCGVWVSRRRLDLHIANRHPDDLLQRRLNPTTGKAEYRCSLCEGLSLRWFSAQSLRGHRRDKHDVHEAEEEMASV
ncbi:hypothetical protein GGF50DRAFT_42673 [Schizophyllum commune]